MGDPILLEVKDGIALVTLNNPPLNVVTLELTRRLNDTLDALRHDPACRVLVLTGSGEKAFCAGSDIKEFPALMAPGVALAKKMIMENIVYSKVDDFPKPTIAAVRGIAMGGGLEMAVACDLIVVEEDSRLALPEVNLGVFPGSGGTIRVTRRIGEGRAKEMMFMCEPIDAQKALAWGLVNRVAPKGQALEVAMDLAAKIAAKPNLALRLCKESVDLSFDTTENEAIQRTLVLIDQAFASHDCQEGVRAFIEKRPPRYTHS